MFFQHFQIKTWPRIDLILLGFWRVWCRWTAGNLSSSTVRLLSKSEQYLVDLWPLWIFGNFLQISILWKNGQKFSKNGPKFQSGHKSTKYCSDFDKISTVEERRFTAVQRHQACQNPSSIRSIHDHVLIPKIHTSYPRMRPEMIIYMLCERTFSSPGIGLPGIEMSYSSRSFSSRYFYALPHLIQMVQ